MEKEKKERVFWSRAENRAIAKGHSKNKEPDPRVRGNTARKRGFR